MPASSRERRRLHIALEGNRALPVVAGFAGAAGLAAIRAALPEAAAAFAGRLDRAEAPNRTPGALESARTARRDGFRITYWLQRTEATFCVVAVGADGDRNAFVPTPQTLHVVAEPDIAAPQPSELVPDDDDIRPGPP